MTTNIHPDDGCAMLNVSKPLPDREFIHRLRAIMPADGPRLPIVAGGGNRSPGWAISNQSHWTYARRVFGLVINQPESSRPQHTRRSSWRSRRGRSLSCG